MTHYSKGNKPSLRSPTPQGLRIMQTIENNPHFSTLDLEVQANGTNVSTWWAYYRNVVKPAGGLEAWKRKRNIA